MGGLPGKRSFFSLESIFGEAILCRIVDCVSGYFRAQMSSNKLDIELLKNICTFVGQHFEVRDKREREKETTAIGF